MTDIEDNELRDKVIETHAFIKMVIDSQKSMDLKIDKMDAKTEKLWDAVDGIKESAAKEAILSEKTRSTLESTNDKLKDHLDGHTRHAGYVVAASIALSGGISGLISKLMAVFHAK